MEEPLEASLLVFLVVYEPTNRTEADPKALEHGDNEKSVADLNISGCGKVKRAGVPQGLY